jgi:Universal stress protein family
MRVWQSSQRLSGFRSILVDVDVGAEVHYALERGVRLAQATGARLRIVTVVPPLGIGSSWPGPDDYHDYRHRRARLEGLATSVRGVAVDCNLFVGRVAPALVDEVVRSGHDLLLRLHLRDAIPWAPKEFRDVNAQLFRNCPCPVGLLDMEQSRGSLTSSPPFASIHLSRGGAELQRNAFLCTPAPVDR